MFQGQSTIRANLVVTLDADNGYGLVVVTPNRELMRQDKPVRLEVYRSDKESVEEYAVAYFATEIEARTIWGVAEVHVADDVTIIVEDLWRIEESTFHVSRMVEIHGNAPDGFLSALTLEAEEGVSLSSFKIFVPGMIYASSEYITPTAIGGTAHYEAGVRQVRIREDRLPIPMVGLYYSDGTSVTLINSRPNASTNVRDAEEKIATNQINEDCRVASLGYREDGNRVTLGMWFPGTEGEVTYQWALAPENQVRKWRGRYHPLRGGLTQRYEADFRVAHDESFSRFYTNAWRWAWNKLAPQITPQDIELVRRTSVAMVADRVVSAHGKSGIPTIWDSTTGKEISSEDSILTAKKREAVMGFLGRNTELAYFLLYEAANGHTEQARRYRTLAISILDSFTNIPASPPAAEGFSLADGSLVSLTFRGKPLVHLRALSEGVKSTLKAWELEKAQGRDHPRWLQWSIAFVDWLLAQQQPHGGFPRAWRMPGVHGGDEPSKSSYSAIPLLVHASKITDRAVYLDAALKAGEFCWTEGHSMGHFVGGTLDNPDVVDKEAGTLSLEAYLALFEATRADIWLYRATEAATFAETWIYCWNVPMPEDADPKALHWKEGVSSVGYQLISTGHSAVDGYMAFDVASYAKLYSYTGDSHYLDVARILLHNTKQMLALPGRTFDFAGPGWQQEGWNLTPPRGIGWHRHWLPWIAASHLTGIIELEQFDPELYRLLTENEPM
ncbi:MAG TPA: hypothetical protein VF088_18405 [Pyrinomonadaceae bacterium]